MSLSCRSRARLLRSFALDRGFATAEFAIVLPAVVLVAAMVLWVLSLFFTQLQIQAASYSMARNLSRGQLDIAGLQAQLPSNYKVQESAANNFVTVRVGVHKSLLNQRIPWGVDLEALAVSELERSSADASN